MTVRYAAILIPCGLTGLLVVARVALWPLVAVRLPEVPALPPSGRPAKAGALLSDTMVGRFVSRDPFRLARRAAPIAYDPLRLTEQLAPPPAKPSLTLLGLVAGADPSAVIVGLPSVDGPRVMRQGETVAGIRVRRITADGVWLMGMDTTWVLRLRMP